MKHLLESLYLLACLFNMASADDSTFTSDWHRYPGLERIWIGPDYWANRLQDWRLAGGRLECIATDPKMPMRTVHLTTVQLNDQPQGFQMQVRTGPLVYGTKEKENSWSGFLIGVGHGTLNYKSACLVHHFSGTGGGLVAGLDDSGKLFFRSNEQEEPKDTYPEFPDAQWDGHRAYSGGWSDNWKDIRLTLKATPMNQKEFKLELTAVNHKTGEFVSKASLEGVDESFLRGNVALVSHPGKLDHAERYWFRDLKISGGKIDIDPDHAFGPVLNTLYSFNDHVLKLTAQFPPLCFDDSHKVEFYTRPADSDGWILQDTATIESLGYIARFRVENWNASEMHRYQVRYTNYGKTYTYSGTITKDPVEKNEIVIAGFTGNQCTGRSANAGWGSTFAGHAAGRWIQENLWFPHTHVTNNIPRHGTDLLFFSGDQIYEGGSPTASQHQGNNPALDYLYKWFIFCWDFQVITKDLPSIVIVDDHDVYQGDLWGDGGTLSLTGSNKQGGYTQTPEFVNMVQRINCSHNPDPYDPAPVKNDIEVYYGSCILGGISIAFLEDRKFKSLPTIVPNREMNGSKIINENYAPDNADVPGATLLGERQLDFLDDWVRDWDDAFIKVALMQTTFASLHTRPDGKPWLDMDSNGWPQTPRDTALKTLRKGCAFMYAGDTHLGAVIHHGVDDFEDAGYSFVVPSLSNKYRRWWTPAQKGIPIKSGMPDYTGHFKDGFDNLVTVYAAGNPTVSCMEVFKRNGGTDDYRYGSEHLFLDRSKTKDGYGIVRLDKNAQTITMECWPWNVTELVEANQYQGWPVTIHMQDNYGRKAYGYLPRLQFEEKTSPVVEVIDEKNGGLVYSLRVNSDSFDPRVFHDGSYTVLVYMPEEKGREQRIRNLNPEPRANAIKLDIKL